MSVTSSPGWVGFSHGAQTRWLATRLAALWADPRMSAVVVFLHQGVYASNPAHGSDAGVRAAWAGLFDRDRVDLVCSGHNHGSERTHFVRAGRRTVPGRGTLYVTAGAGGQSSPPEGVVPHGGRAPVWSAPGVRTDEPECWRGALPAWP
jgi:hypothetical protein